MKKVIALSLIAALFCTVAVFAGGGGQGGSGGGTHVFIPKSTGNPYFDKMWEGFQEAVRAAGGTPLQRAPDAATIEGQIRIIDQLIAQRVASITISANDEYALQPAITRAMQAGIKVISSDSATNPSSRMTHVNQAGVNEVGKTLIEAAFDLTGGSGEFAILSATSTATNQNAWIAVMQAELTSNPKYSNLRLVQIAYGDDEPIKSTTETQALLSRFPNLKAIVAPTAAGVPAVARAVQDSRRDVKVTGLGLPSQMAEYIQSGVAPYVFLWNPAELGYLSAYVAMALSAGAITGSVGERFTAGRLGQYTIVQAGDNGTEIILGPPFRFDASNIAEWRNVY